MFWYLYYADNYQYSKLGITRDPVKRFRTYGTLMGNDGHYHCLIRTSLPKSRMEVYEREILRLTMDNAPPSDMKRHERRSGNRDEIMNVACDLFGRCGVRYTLEDVKGFKAVSKYTAGEIINNRTPIFLRDYQEKIVNEWDFSSGIIVMPPGMGKTITACAMISKYLGSFPNGVVLWHVKLKDIIISQWTEENINKLLISGILPCAPKIYVNNDWDEIENKFIICNSAQIDRISAFINPTLIITDECHNITADDTYNTLKRNCEAIQIGLSATPIKKSFTSIERAQEIYGLNMLANISIFDAIDEGYLIPFTIKAMLYNTTAGRAIIINNIREAIENSATKKVICWAKDISSAEQWGADLIPLSMEYFGRECFISTSINDKKCAVMSEFINHTERGLMICVGRFREGTDDPNIDTGINLDLVEKRDYHVQIQMLGRLLRVTRNKLMGMYIDIQEIGSEDDKAKKIMDCIITYCSLINDSVYPLFGVERDGISIKSPSGNIICRVEIGGEIEPDESLYMRTCEELRREWMELKMPYRKFVSMLREYGIECEYEYHMRQKELNLPECPEEEYKSFDWLDIYVEREWYSLEECKERIKRLKRLRSPLPLKVNYHYHLQDNKIPKDIGLAYGMEHINIFFPNIRFL